MLQHTHVLFKYHVQLPYVQLFTFLFLEVFISLLIYDHVGRHTQI